MMMRFGTLRTLGTNVILFAMIAGVVAGYIPMAAASGPCVGGSHIATQADADSVTSGGIIAGVTLVCDTDSSAVSADIGESKQYLSSILRGGSCGPYQTTASGLDPKFAVCAARFLKDARAKDPNIRVVSMFRSSAHQAYLCGGGCGIVNGPCGAPGRSNHQKGMAIDISNGQHILPNWIRAMGKGYGIQFPIANDSGHMEPIPGSNCADANFKPTDTVGDLTPGGSLSDQIRRALGQQPQMPLQQPLPPQPALPAQPTLPAQPVLPAQTGLSPTPSQITPISDIINNNSNTNTNTKSTSTATSTFDLINEFLNPVSDSIDIGTAVDIDLNPDTNDITLLDGKRPTSTLSVPGALAVYQTLSVPQTFTSNDLANNPVSGYVAGENTFLLRILDTMKNTLLYALNYLRPFGGRTPGQPVTE